jgi:hypothetical protein
LFLHVNLALAQSWTKSTAPELFWFSVASSADGIRLVAVINGGGIYTWQSAFQSLPVFNLEVTGVDAVLSWPFYAADFALQQNINLAMTN